MQFDYFTLLVYCARGNSERAKLSQLMKGKCKNGHPKFTKQLAATIFDRKEDSFFADSVLVPVPRSTPLVEGALFPTKIICDILVEKKLGRRVVPCVIRRHRIPKSSGGYTADTRPQLSVHLDSLSVQPEIVVENNIIIVDDFLTLGRSTMAVAMKVQEAYPDKTVKIFAAFRTRGNDNDIFVEIKHDTMQLNSFGKDVRLPD